MMIDFVPIDEQLKQVARERYKICRSVGFTDNGCRQPIEYVKNMENKSAPKEPSLDNI